mmetsp:Transcript_6531/g.9605  ORF Transcript_6531/g.9605 Transcript_6531/m.9605 type:complete len:93 (-) Transcript_6531:112-390(-)
MFMDDAGDQMGGEKYAAFPVLQSMPIAGFFFKKQASKFQQLTCCCSSCCSSPVCITSTLSLCLISLSLTANDSTTSFPRMIRSYILVWNCSN